MRYDLIILLYALWLFDFFALLVCLTRGTACHGELSVVLLPERSPWHRYQQRDATQRDATQRERVCIDYGAADGTMAPAWQNERGEKENREESSPCGIDAECRRRAMSPYVG